MTTYTRPAVTAEVVGQSTLEVEGGFLTLDALNIPYGDAVVEIPRTEDLDLTDMDPRVDTRVIVTGRDEVTGASRAFNLGLRSRDIVDNGRRVSLSLATDEALLKDYAALAEDTAALALQGSLRAVVNYVLGKIGATLEPGGPDADVTATANATNLAPNGGFRVNTNGWTGNSVQLTRMAGGPPGVGVSYFGRATNLGGVSGGGIFNIGGEQNTGSTMVAVVPGTLYRVSLWVRSSVAVTVALHVEWVTETGAGAGTAYGQPVNLAANTWTELTSYATASNSAARAGTYCYRTSGTWPAGVTLDAAAHRFSPTPEGYADANFPFFDGSTPASALYTYKWNAAANESSSQRIALVDRSAESLVWTPGTTAWAFLEPLNTTAGLRLYCDEARRWYLIDPATHAVPGLITLGGFNLTEGADTVSREDEDVFCTGVVVKYKWRTVTYLPELFPNATPRPDPLVLVPVAEDHTAYDSAGTPAKVFIQEYERPYPGPGAAAAILKRRSGTGRTQAVTGLAIWAATPGMECTITLPGSDQTKGKVASVRFSLGDDALMEVGTRGLIDIPAGSWDAGPTTVTWDTVTGTWQTFQW